eukprot:gnl/Chilomastix_caulleri/1689.p1 GENE.gnl/Chilomastix_caulleri/1689~~gnl/Chilomastix_caulleri/1689.p1  ORF type:complete len:85 (-),score=23.56 gnl/Chilomastix_caulleri/1689:41-295(-)
MQPGCTFKVLFAETVSLILRGETPTDLVRRFSEILDASHLECEEASVFFMDVLHSAPVAVAASETRIREAAAAGIVGKWERILE